MRLAHRQGAARIRSGAARAPAAQPKLAAVKWRVARRDRLPVYERLRRARNSISIHNAREHNLKNIDVAIPRDQFTVITGVSGSGKSTLAFDILFAEGQRRYLESLNAYARQFVQPAARPDVDAIFGIPPTVAIEQRTSRGGRKSTVATLTEIYHFLRLLFVKLGTQYCPDCDVPIEPQSVECDRRAHPARLRGSRIGLLAPLVVARKGYYTDLAKWARGKGYTHLRVDGELLPTDKWPRLDRFQEHTIELPVADVQRRSPTTKPRCAPNWRARSSSAKAWCTCWRRSMRSSMRGEAASPQAQRVLGQARLPFVRHAASPSSIRGCSRSTRKHGWCGDCFGTGSQLDGFDWERRAREDRRRGPRARLVDRMARGRRDLPCMRRQAAESRGAARALPRSVDRRPHRARRRQGRRVLPRICSWKAAKRRSRATSMAEMQVAARLS